MTAYDFVPLPSQVRRIQRDFARHDKRLPGYLFGRILIEYTCMQPVHVGSGFKELRNGEVVRLGVSRNGMPAIPGASLKGVLRARYEGITQSCILLPLTWGKDKRGKDSPMQVRSHRGGQMKPPVKHAMLAPNANKQLERVNKCRSQDALCPACALFGSQTGQLAQLPQFGGVRSILSRT